MLKFEKKRGGRVFKTHEQIIAATPGAIRDLAPDSSPHAVEFFKYDPAKHCCWPLGDPTTPEFRFCGDMPSTSRYCERHHKMAYRPATR